MRTWLNDARSYIEPVQVGAVMRALGIGRVLASGTIDFREGDLVGSSCSSMESSCVLDPMIDGLMARATGVRRVGMAGVLARSS